MANKSQTETIEEELKEFTNKANIIEFVKRFRTCYNLKEEEARKMRDEMIGTGWNY